MYYNSYLKCLPFCVKTFDDIQVWNWQINFSPHPSSKILLLLIHDALSSSAFWKNNGTFCTSLKTLTAWDFVIQEPQSAVPHYPIHAVKWLLMKYRTCMPLNREALLAGKWWIYCCCTVGYVLTEVKQYKVTFCGMLLQ